VILLLEAYFIWQDRFSWMVREGHVFQAMDFDFMETATEHRFPGPVTVFQERRLPERATPAGYSALIDAYGLEVPLPLTLSAIGDHHRVVERAGWRITTPRHQPHPSLAGHLTFALKYEGLDLTVLKRLFLATGPAPIEAVVH